MLKYTRIIIYGVMLAGAIAQAIGYNDVGAALIGIGAATGVTRHSVIEE